MTACYCGRPGADQQADSIRSLLFCHDDGHIRVDRRVYIWHSLLEGDGPMMEAARSSPLKRRLREIHRGQFGCVTGYL
ncbi:predicted protein [Coccidioides posadasii str. Silveira]|uniref:Predicted protein n=1 Tax=Coccidioides posadasii (strain RMSCC 757 / Silveira) TaxID=443226 RepID=E9D905_COCPS|nr:predicted protein [Coccidioides posadasii str. Silveira]